jgi:ribosome-associated translation inhibitor RaiA
MVRRRLRCTFFFASTESYLIGITSVAVLNGILVKDERRPMKLPLQISFKNLERDDLITSIVKDKAAKLDRLCSDVIQCRVTIDVPHRNHRKGNFYDVTVDVSVPGKEIVWTHESQNEIENKDIRHVLKVAFDAVYRMVEEYNRMRHSDAA